MHNKRSKGAFSGRRLPSSGRHILIGLLVAAALTLCAVPFAAATTSDYPDVPGTHPYRLAISHLSARGIITGYPDGRFGAENAVTRQQFAKMIVLTMGYQVPNDIVCPFSDVTKTPNAADPLYPASYVAICALRGITQGRTPTQFDPYANISRLQVLTMVVRALDDAHPRLLATPPSDFVPSWNPQRSPQHGANAAKAEFNGLLSGIDMTPLDPLGPMTRGEIAQVLHAVLARITPPTTTTTAVVSTTTSSSSTTTEWTTTTTCG
jgi:hypothetical protein